MQQRFSHLAPGYATQSDTQRQIAADLIAALGEPVCGAVLDVGCGHGNLYELVKKRCDRFVGIDFAPGMCALHPKGRGVEILQIDFNLPLALQALQAHAPFDLILSSSALQWAEDLGRTLNALRPLGNRFALAIATSQSFSELHGRVAIKSPLPDRHTIERAIESTLGLKGCVRRYTLEFETPRMLLNYVRQSGVSGFHHGLSYRQVRTLMEDRTLKRLSFEVVMAVGQPG